MPIYDYKGVQYDIETADPEEAKRKILAHIGPEKGAADYAKDFGKSAASLADTALNAVTGTLDYGAYNLARAAGLSPERATQETTSPKDVVGRAFGITQDPAYQQEASRRLIGGVGQGIEQYAVKPIASATGLPEQDVASMVNTGMIAAAPAAARTGRAVKQGAEATAQAARNVGGAAMDVGKGVYGGFTDTIKQPGQPVKPWETASARQPIGDTYIPAPVLEQWRAGKITAEQAQAAAQSTSNLPQTALKRTQGMVPYAGQEWRALGEQIGAGYRDPYKLVAEAGTDFLTGGGIPSAIRAGMKANELYQGQKAFRQLGQAGFTPITAAEQSALRIGGQYPGTTPPSGSGGSAAGPVRPGPMPPENQMMLPLSSRLAPPASEFQLTAPPGPVIPPPPSAGISQTPQQMAAARIQPGLDPARQAAADTVLAQIRARGETEKAARVAALQSRAAAAGGYTPPRVEAPVAPVAPTAMPTAAPAPAAPVSTLDTLRGRLTPMTAEQQAAVDAYNAKPPVEKAAQTRAETAAKTVATTPAPVVKSTMTPTEKRISFNELAKDVEGAKEFGIVYDIKNKTRTEPGNSPDTMPSDMRGVLPNNVKWEKSVEHWNPDGADVAFTEYYTAKTTKNSPVYKYVEPETGDGVLYKQGTGNNWTKVDSMEFPVPKGVLKATEGRAAVQAALDSGQKATIKYKTSTGIITENVNQSIKFKPDADLALTHRIDRPDHSNTLFGTEKSSGKPVKVEITNLSALENNPEYIKVFDNSNPKSPVLIKTYDLNGTLTSKQRNKLKKE